jgi:hypothetical protein
MQKLFGAIRKLIGILLTRRPAAIVSGGNSALDWLPPVLGPGDWSMGLMADRSCAWYFDRH